MECKKCDNVASIKLRKKDLYCQKCFLNNTNHKFRACLGKSKLLSPNEKVLVCLSEGLGSTVLLDLVYTGVMMDSHKKLQMNPLLFHVIEINQDNDSDTKKLLEKCQKYGLDLYVSHISNYMQTDIELPDVNTIPVLNENSEKQLRSLLSSISATIKNDFIQKIKRNLYISFSKLLGCNSIMTGEYTNTLAINLLSGIAMGRGTQLEDDVGFCDKRNTDIKVLRSMKDISKEELDHYVKIKYLNVISANNNLQDNSLHCVIRNYVNDLQENFQATISTICKTAGKLGFHSQNGAVQKCLICEAHLNNDMSKFTALDATNFSRGLSSGVSALDATNFAEELSSGLKIHAVFTCCESTASSVDEDLHIKMIPFIHTHLCYNCGKNCSEMGNDKLPNFTKLKLTQI